jgi:REP element-mobilizing transposase RayT
MTERFQGKYRIPSARWQQWNYGDNGNYFVTICTANWNHFFGKIIPDNNSVASMQLYPAGKIAEQLWLEIPSHFPFVRLDSFVVMPNHIHGILVVDKPATIAYGTDDVGMPIVETPNLGVSTTKITTDARKQTIAASGKWKPATIGVIINQFKRKVTIDCRDICPGFAWQARFHDRVIRDDAEYRRIVYYIENNVSNWVDDSYFSI